jgi:hypothetical protein
MRGDAAMTDETVSEGGAVFAAMIVEAVAVAPLAGAVVIILL